MGDDATGMPIDRETNAAAQQSLRVLTLTLPEVFLPYRNSFLDTWPTDYRRAAIAHTCSANGGAGLRRAVGSAGYAVAIATYWMQILERQREGIGCGRRSARHAYVLRGL